MREQINQLLEESINIIIDNINNFERMHPSNPYKEKFLEGEKDNLNWTINFKNKLNKPSE